MRTLVIALAILFGGLSSAMAQLSIGIAMPGVSIGLNLPVFPELVRVPNYPVYYAPGLRANYFFFDGMYWVYQDDSWYASTWYNGPWELVAPEWVPLYVLRIPVRYYRSPPPYFRGWRPDAPPRWGEHWGPDWEHQRDGWNRWNRRAAPAPAPLPLYQRRYSGDRYPHEEQQRAIQGQNYRHRPTDPVVQQHFPQQVTPRPPAPPPQRERPPIRQEGRPMQQDAPHPGGPPRGRDDGQRAMPPQVPPPQRADTLPPPRQPPRQGAAEREPDRRELAPPRGGPQDHGRGRGQGQDKEREKDDERGQPPRNRP